LLVVRALGLLFTSGKLPPLRLASVPATLSVPNHLTPPFSLCAGSRTSPEPRATPRLEGPAPSPPLSSDAINRAGELCLSVIRPPRFDSLLGTVSVRCAEVHGCFPWTSSRGPSNRRASLAAPRHALRAVWTSTWFVHGLRFGPRRARQCPIARVNLRAQLGRQVATVSHATTRALSVHAVCRCRPRLVGSTL
jgi:hypothetical protein